jgi:hypothetical protein
MTDTRHTPVAIAHVITLTTFLLIEALQIPYHILLQPVLEAPRTPLFLLSIYHGGRDTTYYACWGKGRSVTPLLTNTENTEVHDTAARRTTHTRRLIQATNYYATTCLPVGGGREGEGGRVKVLPTFLLLLLPPEGQIAYC